jgi:hypothetical protein
MRFTFTGRRLALAAVLVLGGVAAPLAYATIADAGKGGNAPAKKPTKIVTPLVQAGKTVTGAASAPTAVGDPYQVVFVLTKSFAGEFCDFITPPVGSPFVLESVELLIAPPSSADVKRANWFTFAPVYHRSNGGSAYPYYGFNIPLDAQGDGQQFFNLLIRPNSSANAAAGDIHQFFVCIDVTTAVEYLIVLTGKSAPSGPTPAQVSSFDATSGRAGATLQWKTASETEILGFNVWRYRGAKGVKVNQTLVRAKRSGEPKGASYRYVDPVAGAKRGLTYRLQLVDLKGKRTWYAAFAIASK